MYMHILSRFRPATKFGGVGGKRQAYFAQEEFVMFFYGDVTILCKI